MPTTAAYAIAAACDEIVAGSWEVSRSRDLVRDQWHKLLWNAGFNAICAVTGATVNAGGRLVVRATRVGADTALAQIARLVTEAQNGKAAVQRVAPGPGEPHATPA